RGTNRRDFGIAVETMSPRNTRPDSPPPGMELTTNPRVTTANWPGRTLFLLGLLALVSTLAPVPSRAQSASDLKKKAEEAGITSEEDALRKAKAAGMTHDQILQALREAGYSEAAVEEILRGEPQGSEGRKGAPSYT